MGIDTDKLFEFDPFNIVEKMFGVDDQMEAIEAAEEKQMAFQEKQMQMQNLIEEREHRGRKVTFENHGKLETLNLIDNTSVTELASLIYKTGYYLYSGRNLMSIDNVIFND